MPTQKTQIAWKLSDLIGKDAQVVAERCPNQLSWLVTALIPHQTVLDFLKDQEPPTEE